MQNISYFNITILTFLVFLVASCGRPPLKQTELDATYKGETPQIIKVAAAYINKKGWFSGSQELNIKIDCQYSFNGKPAKKFKTPNIIIAKLTNKEQSMTINCKTKADDGTPLESNVVLKTTRDSENAVYNQGKGFIDTKYFARNVEKNRYKLMKENGVQAFPGAVALVLSNQENNEKYSIYSLFQ